MIRREDVPPGHAAIVDLQETPPVADERGDVWVCWETKGQPYIAPEGTRGKFFRLDGAVESVPH